MKKNFLILLVVISSIFVFVGNVKAEDLSQAQCSSISNQTECTKKPECYWDKGGDEQCTKMLTYVKCGDSAGAKNIPADAPRVISIVIKVFKIITPIALILSSMVSLLKSLAASKEDDIAKAKQTLVRRIIAGILVFFVISIVQLVLSIIAENKTEANNIADCIDCFANNNCKNSIYYEYPAGAVHD